MGVRAQKCPLDLWVYQEIIWDTRPDLIVETGTSRGGSALYLATMFDLIGEGEVISIDVRNDEMALPEHGRITFLTGDSVDPKVATRVAELARGRRTMVVLDSNHSKRHVAAEMAAYAALVAPGCYLIVEDSNINGNPVLPEYGPGPAEAIEEFLAGNHEFAMDREREKFLLTFNPRGFLRRLRPQG